MVARLFVGLREFGLALRRFYIFKRPLLLLLLGYALLLFVLHQTGIFPAPPKNDPARLVGKRVEIAGVAETPETTARGASFVLSADMAKDTEADFPRWKSVRGRTLVQVSRRLLSVTPGDRVFVKGRLQAPAPAPLSGAFDAREWLANQNVFSVLYTGEKQIRNAGPTGTKRLEIMGWTLKNKFVSALNQKLSPDHAALYAGLCVGERPRASPGLKNIFLASGTMHILVASGSNVAFVVLAWFLFARFLCRIPRRWALGTALLPIALYVLVAGADAPIVRAGVMSAVGLVSYLLARDENPLHALGVAALAILLWAPAMLFNVGFQMSFLTVYGLMRWPGSMLRLKNAWGRWVALPLVFSLTAEIWLIPIYANVFHQIYPLGFMANLFVLPMSGVGLVLGFLVALAPNGPAGALIVDAGTLFARLMIGTVRFFATHVGWRLWLMPMSWLSLIFYFSLCILLPSLKKYFWGALAAGLLLLGFIGFLFFHEPKAPQEPRLTKIEAGRRVWFLLETPAKKRVLIVKYLSDDLEKEERSLFPHLAVIGRHKIDLAVFVLNPPDLDTLERLKTNTQTREILISTTSNKMVSVLTKSMALQFLPEESTWEKSGVRFRYLSARKSGRANALVIETDGKTWVVEDGLSLKEEKELSSVAPNALRTNWTFSGAIKRDNGGKKRE